MARDVCDDVAAVVVPVPVAGQVDPPELFDDVAAEVRAEQREYAERLRVAYDEADVDPVLAEIVRLRRERDRCERRMRQLVAYGREFVGPRPYPLAALAAAAGLANHSSARTFYGPEEIGAVAGLTGAKQRSPRPAAPVSDAAATAAPAAAAAAWATAAGRVSSAGSRPSAGS